MASRELLLLRHAKSSWGAPDSSDRERPLAPRGERAAAAMGVYLAQRGALPEHVLCSPARRTRETWERVRAALPAEPPLGLDEALYEASPGALLERVRAVGDEVASLLVIGHNPGLAGLAVQLAGGGDRDALERLERKFPTAGLAVLALPEGPWSALRPGAGALRDFRTPKDLL